MLLCSCAHKDGADLRLGLRLGLEEVFVFDSTELGLGLGKFQG